MTQLEKKAVEMARAQYFIGASIQDGIGARINDEIVLSWSDVQRSIKLAKWMREECAKEVEENESDLELIEHFNAIIRTTGDQEV